MTFDDEEAMIALWSVLMIELTTLMLEYTGREVSRRSRKLTPLVGCVTMEVRPVSSVSLLMSSVLRSPARIIYPLLSLRSSSSMLVAS